MGLVLQGFGTGPEHAWSDPREAGNIMWVEATSRWMVQRLVTGLQMAVTLARMNVFPRVAQPLNSSKSCPILNAPLWSSF
jgi:hypothetical protein